MTGRLVCADVLEGLRDIPDGSIDLILTSPPYADRRKRQYGGPPADEYVAWYIPIARALKPKLRRTGSYVLNIKESVNADGQRDLYVLDLVAAHVRQAGWRWHDTFVWHKPNPFPGNRGARLPDAWEPCYQFVGGGTGTEPYIDKQANRRPLAPETITKRAYVARLDAAGELAARAPAAVHNNHDNPANLAVGAARITTPDAQAHNHVSIGVLAGAGHGLEHPAMYPERLAAWFIRLLAPPGGVVLDPFVGSGTTAAVAERLGRRWIGIDRNSKYIDMARARIGPHQHEPLIPAAPPESDSRSEPPT